MLLLVSGVRRGELCGLSLEDVDEEHGLIHIRRASQYQRHKGVVEVPTKNENSERAIDLPQSMFDILRVYIRWWKEQRLAQGSRWKGDAARRLFIQDDGSPINPDTINYWLKKFIQKHNLPYFTPHSLRHTFATIQIAENVDLRTVQARTGHAQMSTLVNTYTHLLKSKAAQAAGTLEQALDILAVTAEQ